MAALNERGIPLSAVSPRYLHSNSTSHTGPFSAVAELIDNAYDPDVSAKHLWIDKTVIKDQDCLIFMDNGKGMDYDKMHKMLSFGFSDKLSVGDHAPVGLYGNGFKSGSMRLGKDVIVFSKKADTMCVGLLSQTYLEKIEAQNVIVPIVMFKNAGQIGSVAQEYEKCLHDILNHSIFETKEDLLHEFSAINGPYETISTGTRIIIWNLRKTSSGVLEFDFTKDRYDIQLPVESTQELNEPERGISAPDCEYSLRAYSSILYLKPRMQIIIQGQKVKTQLVSKSLAQTFKDTYRPTFLKKGIKISFGYNTKSKDHYGLMLYHKNRLIKAYEHVACQRKANKTGVGVVGVLECNYLKPMHNKQDFEKTEEYRKTLQNVSSKLEEYWKEIRYRRQKSQNCSVSVEDEVKRPDQNWVECNDCSKWRKLPDGIDNALLPDKWFCYMNPDPQFRCCEVQEEPEDSDDEQPRYQKTYKQDEKNQKLQKEKDSQQSPTQEIPEPLYTTPNSHPHRNAGSRSAHIQTASPISARKKRTLGSSRENGEMKRARIEHFFDSSTPGNQSTATASPKFCSLPNIINPDVDQASSKDNETGANADDDDDILIIERISSPRPKSPTGTFDITKVKLQCTVSEEELERQMEHGDSDFVVSMLHPRLSFRDVCIGTQTQQNSAVKQEEEDSKGRKKEKGGKDGESNNVESEKDLSSVEMNSSTYLKSINEETKLQQKSVPSLEEKYLERNNTESLINSEEELSHMESSNEITGGGQTSAKLENSVLNLLEAQQQQDKLLEFLDVVTKERDESQAQLLLLSLEVEKLRSQLLELTQSMLKKKHSDQNTQTSPEEAQDYQVLYLQGKEEIKQLQEELGQLKKEERERKGQQALLEVDDELACQIDLLLRQIDQGNKEREELMNKVDSLENSKSTFLKRESEKIKLCADVRGIQTDFPICSHEQSAATSAEASTSRSGTDFGTQHETHQILRDLRQKVARLLVKFVPALDHQQVNYDCNVIDEILTDVVNEISPAETASTKKQ